MKIQIDDTLTVEVYFDVADREEGFTDEIRFSLHQFGAQKTWLFPANTISFLLTLDQAEKLAMALNEAVTESRNTLWQ
jgi:hypothetical protein